MRLRTLLLGFLQAISNSAQDPGSESWDSQHIDPRYKNLPTLSDKDALFDTNKDGLKLLARAQRDCTIPRISAARFTRADFLSEYYQKAPVVVVGLEQSDGKRVTPAPALISVYLNLGT
jgi:hypothetical protein